VVVRHTFAAAHLGGPAAALGRVITLDGVAHTVVGVLPPGHEDLAAIRAVAWSALQVPAPTRRGPFGLRAFGRLKPGVTLEAAAQDVAAISERIFPLWEAGFRDRTARYTPIPLRETIVARARGQLRLFAGAVVLVLLVAVANVATLMLVRAAAREPELAVRSALGASRPRLARLVATEGLIVTALATALALVGAAWALGFVGAIAPGLPRAREIAFDPQTMGLALGLGLACGLLVSVSPVLAVWRGRIAPVGADARRSGGTRGSQRARGVLVAAEFALAVPLLAAAALLASSFVRLQRVDPGYDMQSTFAVPLNPPGQRYATPEALAGYLDRALQRALETPGVVAAGLSSAAPPDNQGNVNNFNLVAHPVPPGGAEPVSPWDAVTPGFFEALRIPLLEGRMFGPGDSAGAPPVILVSRAWAQRYFPGEPVLGQLVIGGGCYECPRTTIVGVVGDVKYQGLAGGGDGVYTPLVQSNMRGIALFVRTAASPEPFIRPVVEALRAVDPEVPLAGVPLAAQVRRALADPGRWTTVLAAFAAAALGLAALGVFGLMSYVVRRQRREIGVRMALGAAPRDVIRMILARGMRYAAAGLAIGLVLAVVQGRWLAALLYDVTPRDPATLAGVAAVLLAAALVACLVPGVRAARIKPIEAIAEE
jgi:putative ABC transport system permease protein